ncbi:hypothetical protein AR438_17125 [Chryseobacterium aquaticum]|uniref:Bacterial toxin 44 domain-containing protein n=2 Tax=Chryseobacterium aquaticum TaxID=452084 RepID=A0A0Q3HNF1_9FLAO|nr:hypothetical protein AR438_17125 [Chryseobacterium aquaticum]
MPYGEMLMENTTMNYDHPFKYNGKELDMATGYYYYGARYYDPKRSFWLSVDPLADITLSTYAYVWNDPVNFIDPTGLMGERVGGKGPNPDSWWRRLTWTKAHRYAQRYANKMESGNSTVNTYKHNDGDWSVNTNYGNGTGNKATFSNKGEVYNKNWGVYTGDAQGQNEGSNTITNYPAPSFNSPTISESRASNSLGAALGNPSGQLAVAALYGLQGGTSAIAAEYIAAKTGLNFLSMFGKNSGFGWASSSSAGNLEAFGVQVVKPTTEGFAGIVNNPKSLWGMSKNNIQAKLGEGWIEGSYGSNGQGWKFLNGDRSVFYNQSSSAHGGAEYWGFSAGDLGKTKIVNPATYIRRVGDKARIIPRKEL